jgi:hypothetical protein
MDAFLELCMAGLMILKLKLFQQVRLNGDAFAADALTPLWKSGGVQPYGG